MGGGTAGRPRPDRRGERGVAEPGRGPGDEASPLAAFGFYFDADDSATSRRLQRIIRHLGGAIELFFSPSSVTHVISGDPQCCSIDTYHGSSTTKSSHAANSSVSRIPFRRVARQQSSQYKSRTDAMLESVSNLPQLQTPTVLQQARLWNVPIWTFKKVENFLNNITSKVQWKTPSQSKSLKGKYIKFESLDRKHRAIYKEFNEWPDINSLKEGFGSPFEFFSFNLHASSETTGNFQAKSKRKAGSKNNVSVNIKSSSPEINAHDCNSRMTRKARPRVKEHAENPPKQNGYCEICRTSYSILADHERTTTHINFTNNCANFLSLDSLINDGIDVESFLKMNKSNIQSPNLERRSLRNMKLHQNSETQGIQKQILMNGNSDSSCKSITREKRSEKDQTIIHPTSSPINNNGHYLRSKGTSGENDKISPRESKRELIRNGSISPRIISPEKNDSLKVNGKIDDIKETRFRRRPRSIRWRRPSPDSNPTPPDNQTYYKVVGMSTKLRSSNNFTHIQKDIEPVPPPSRQCNGDSESGLVVKFRRVRRSELSVLSDEAENFMFPKKDDSDSTEDEVESSHYSRSASTSEMLSTTNSGINCKIKEEVLSGDDFSQDSYNSDCVRRKGRRRTKTVPYLKEHQNSKYETSEPKTRLQSLSSLDAITNKSDSCNKEIEIPNNKPSEQSRENCLKWVDGKLQVSPEVDNLTYTFEKVPAYEPWYETFKRQDEGREKTKSIAQYLGYYWKSPILPYEMGYLSPLKPNCCALSQLKKLNESKGPTKLYGTRGLKKKKNKLENLQCLSKNPRKSPREHASTLAILGSLIHKKKNKACSSEDSKSLPSITEEDISNDMPFIIKLPEIPISEETKKLEDFFSDLYDDSEDYDAFIENLDYSVKIEKPPKPNVIDLLESYDQCNSIENTVKEIQDSIQKRGVYQRKRKGYKFKKKNKTGWPAKKRIQAKKEIPTLLESADSSRDASVNRDSCIENELHSPVVLNETYLTNEKLDQVSNNCVDKSKNQKVNSNYLVLENNDNSIMSFSDMDDKISSSLKCKVIADTDLSNSEEENFSNNSDLNLKQCDSIEYSVSDGTNSSENKIHHSTIDMEMQPVVRVQKIDTRIANTRGIRKLRSSNSPRRPRRHFHR